MNNKNKIIQLIEGKKQQYYDCSDKIWGYAETRFDVEKSAKELSKLLKNEGFEIEMGLADMDYAFVATFGEGEPQIGILAEYDALGNLSQVADLAEKKPLEGNGNGHGCGHHMLGVGAVAGAVGIKDFMQEQNLKGTIKLFGCPAEESGYGKAFMTRAGVFNGLDAALTWHPHDTNGVFSFSTLASHQIYFNFTGRAAHAGAAPDQGRSALDAAELMNIGVNFLREHIIDNARIHYAFIDAGGPSANVVQPTSSLHYFIRAPKTSQVNEIYERVVKIAQGAALMTETQLEIKWDSACSNYIPNKTLTKAIYENLKQVTPMQITDEELEYMQPFFDSLEENDKKNVLNRAKKLYAHVGEEKVKEVAESPIFMDVLPYVDIEAPMTGSTDVGDVSWVVPTAQFTTACLPQGSPPHSWQWVATGKSSVAHKGVLAAGKVIAMTAYDILKNPELIKEANAEHSVSLDGETYECAIPEDILPL